MTTGLMVSAIRISGVTQVAVRDHSFGKSMDNTLVMTVIIKSHTINGRILTLQSLSSLKIFSR